MKKISLLNRNIGINLKYDNLGIYIVILNLLSFLFYNVTFISPSKKNMIHLFFNISLLLVSLFLQRNYLYTKIIPKLNIFMVNNYKIILSFALSIIFVEGFGFEKISDLKGVLFFVLNIVITVSLLFLNINTENYINFVRKSFSILAGILVVGTVFSLVVMFLYSDIVEYQNNWYLQTKYIFGTSLRQMLYVTDKRITSFFNNPSHYGEYAFLVLTLTPLYYSIQKNKNNQSYFTRNIMVVHIISIVAIFISKTRTAMLIYLLYLFFLLFFIIRVDKEKYIEIFKKYRKFILALFFVGSVVLRVVFSSRGNIFDSNGRNLIFYETLKVVAKNPIFGLGTKNFYNFIAELSGNGHAHNSFLQLLGSGGIIYLGWYLFFYMKLLMSAFKLSNLNRNGFSLISFILSTIIFQMFDNKVLGIHFQFTLLIVIYICLQFSLTTIEKS